MSNLKAHIFVPFHCFTPDGIGIKVGIKVNNENYCKHFLKKLFPAIKKLVKWDDRIFVQHSVPSHQSNLVQDFL